MIDVRSKRCIYEDCIKSPLYNIPTLKTPIYCKEHKLDEMIDVKSKRCIYEIQVSPKKMIEQ